MFIVAILQARANSSRLPNKVMLPILGVPMLAHQIQRIKHSKMIDKLIVATSIESTDDQLEEVCRQENIDCFRGKLDDVLDRFYQAALYNKATQVVRLTGDCPLADYEIIDSVIGKHVSTDADYTSNTSPPTFADGLDVEVMKFSVLKDVWLTAMLPSEREHVTLAIRNPERGYDLQNYSSYNDFSDKRWTVDEPNDFKFVTEVYKCLYPENNNFLTKDILLLLKAEPYLQSLNSGINRNEGLIKSLASDKNKQKQEYNL